ncbi:MAG: c-type cytochrome [Gemmatimonadota bacterium]
MRALRRLLNAKAVGGALLLLLAGATPGSSQDGDLARGQEVYERWCAACHGVEGDGLGPAAAWMLPRPRDFTRGLYQIRTTPGGDIPTDADIMRMIDEGMPGTTMPGWGDQLSRQDREAVLAYVKGFYPAFETLPPPEPLDFRRAPGASQERLAEGRSFYESIECWQCHGDAGRGDGPSAPELEDDWGHPIRAVDLTSNWQFNGGGTVEDIYRRLNTGLDGTPMPAFQDLVESGFMTDDQLWNLSLYVRSLAPEDRPQVREVIRAEQVAPGELPATLADALWDEADSFYLPLVGQIIALPRWFDPAVEAVWVQALHDGEEIALRITWSDRSESPDPQWMEWQERVLPIMEPREGDPVEPAPRPDRLVVQFPPLIPEGMDRPYFLMGTEQDPVYQWRWTSDGEGAEPANAFGIHDIRTLDGQIATEANWEEGRWQLLLRRPLEPEGAGDRLRFQSGVPIPIAFFAWDGDHGEDGTRGAISSWYFIYLLEDPPASVYVGPLLAFFLTGGLGLVVVARAQRREREPEEPSDGGPTAATAPPAIP